MAGYGDKKLAGGHAASHPLSDLFPIFAAPSHGKEKNTLRMELIPVGCWKLDDLRFAFDSSFLLPDSKAEFTELAALRVAHPASPMSIFGHADPTGNDDYNKIISGRRARAVYGVLTRDPAIWESLHTNAEGTGDDWGTQHNKVMLSALGFAPGDYAATKAFQKQNDLVDDGAIGPKTRAKLFAAYFAFLCPFSMTKEEFLAKGADPALKGDLQGCSEFNPQMIFSADEAKAFQSPAKKTERDKENAVSRRVLALLFRPGSQVSPAKWPCPTTAEKRTACEKRFWSDWETRRANQEKRRTFAADKNTFACRFYERLVTSSPCEGPVTPIDDKKLRVFLRLSYKDPDGTIRQFPKEMPVVVVAASGAKQTAKTVSDGLLIFDFERAENAFTLEFDHSDHYIAVAAEATTHAEKNRWLAAADVDAAVTDHFRVFKLPVKWSLTQSDWTKVESDLYNPAQFRFEGLSPLAVQLGTDGTPIEMELDPHWQFVRFEFFDRAFGHAAHAGKRIATPPVLLEGFRDGSSAKGKVPNPDTRSNWAVNTADVALQAQALPWIVQRKADKSADARPTNKQLLQLALPANSFIVSTDGATRKVEVIADAAKRKPSAERMKRYDLPTLWKSTKYFTRGAATNKFFNALTDADILTSLDKTKPLTFSLDDIVLVDAAGARADVGGNDLALIFFHQFKKPAGAANLSDEGLYKPGTDLTKPFFPYSNVAMPVKHYLSDYPDWTRIVIINGNIYEAFADRTPDTGNHEVVGARAATMWVDAVAAGQPPPNTVFPRPATVNKPFYSIQPLCYQDTPKVRATCLPQGTYSEWQTPIPTFPGHLTGRYDTILLRCCDLDGTNEHAINLSYFRLAFNFANAPATNADNTPFNPGSYKQQLMANVMKRWNGPETITLNNGDVIPTNRGEFIYLPQTAGALPFQCKPFLFCQDMPQPRSHFQLNVISVPRANMHGATGIGNFSTGNETTDLNTGWLVAAHEVGHGHGLPDEYNERWSHRACSYEFAGFGSQVPGDPYSYITIGDMMNSNVVLNRRDHWACTEWVSRIVGTPLEVGGGTRKLKFPRHPQADNARTFCYHPLFVESRASVGTRGNFDLYLYPYGDETYRENLKAGVTYDGILSVLVKIHYRFDSVAAHTGVTNPIARFLNSIDQNMNRLFVFSGSLGPATFTNALIYFTPRTLVETLVIDGTPANNQYLNFLGYANPAAASQADYTNKVNAVEADHPNHFTIRVVTSGATGWQNSNTLRLTAAQLSAADAWKWFADMVGFNASAAAAPASVLTNATMQTNFARRAVPGSVVTASA